MRKLMALLMAMLPVLFAVAQEPKTYECYIQSNEDTNYYMYPPKDRFFDPASSSSIPMTTTNTGYPFVGARKGISDEVLWVLEEVEYEGKTYVRIRHKQTGKYMVSRAKDKQTVFSIYLSDRADVSDETRLLFSLNSLTSKGRRTVNFRPYGVTAYALNPKTNVYAVRNDEGKAYIKLYDADHENSQWMVIGYAKLEASATGETFTMQPAPQGGEVRYTTDAQDPATSSTAKVYDGNPIVVDPQDYMLRAVGAIDFGGITLFSPYDVYSRHLLAPTITHTDNDVLRVTTHWNEATLYYTTNGSKPTPSSTLGEYSAMGATDDYTFKAIYAYNVGKEYVVSDVATFRVVPAPTVSIVGGKVVMSHPVYGANIYYTLDGTMPTVASAHYTEPIDATDFSLLSAAVVFDGGGSARSRLEPVAIEIKSLSEVTNAMGHYRMADDIDASGFDGFSFGVFKGTFDGGFHTLSGLTVPLFAEVQGTVRNLRLDKVNISTSGDAGAVAAVASASGRIYNCGVLGSDSKVQSSTGGVGSIVGALKGSARVVNCYSYATVKGSVAETTAGIVGNNTVATTQNNIQTMVANCMFYGHLDNGYAVFGGKALVNNGVDAVNGYNYYLDGAVGTLKGYHCTWAAEEQNLTRFEYYRSILNGNRKMMAWWITGQVADTALVAKWVLDPAIAPYPILKPWKRYASVVHQHADSVLDASNRWIARTEALPYQGRTLARLKVHVKAGDHHAGVGNTEVLLDLAVTDMDTLRHDYCYGKVQLPFYNTTFGNPLATDNANRYAGNYTDYVVTGWKITAVVGGEKGEFVGDWKSGYNFADRHCTDKDLYSVSERVFAQGGNYYVPEGVTEITIEAYWGKAIYLTNRERYYESVGVASDGNTRYPFRLAGRWDKSCWPASGWDYTTIDYINKSNVDNYFEANKTVYDQAIVLINSYHLYNSTNEMSSMPFSLMSADLDFDDEPDYYLGLQVGQESTPCKMRSVRFDFLPMPELGMVAKLESNNKFPAIGKMALYGHFEITETANIRFSEFLYDKYYYNTKDEAPLILNAGQFKEIVSSEYLNNSNRKEVNGYYTGRAEFTRYIIVGGNVKMVYFAEGCHNKSVIYTRHVPLNVLGGEFGEVYLSGRNNMLVDPDEDSPHFYSVGGRIGVLAGAAQEKVKGDVVFRIDHSIIHEFYGGGTNPNNKVMGNIDVQIDHSLVHYYCGGPQTGDMEEGKSITTRAKGTVFGQYFGAGNGGTSYALQSRDDNVTDKHGQWWISGYTPLQMFNDNSYYAKFRFEIWSIPPGDGLKHPGRRYYYCAQFSATEAHDVSSTLDECEVLGDFYGAGNLGSVVGNVSSTLKSTHVYGNAFGAGYSASIPSFWVYMKEGVQLPYRDAKSGICYDVVLGDSALYTWTNVAGATTTVEQAIRNTATPTTPNYLYTSEPLTDLGTVTGTVTLTLEGDCMIGIEGQKGLSQSGNVFGGGNESKVIGETKVIVCGNTQVMGNVYGGGNRGAVDGNSGVYLNK